jgi:hypothetical protein
MFICSFTQALSAYAAPAPDNSVVINEFKLDDHTAWIELYNTTSVTIDVSHWRLRNETNNFQEITGSIESHKFKVVEVGNLFAAQEGVISLQNDHGAEVNEITYGTTTVPTSTSSQSVARTAGNTWKLGIPTPEEPNEFDVLAPSVPSGGQPHDAVMTTHSFNFSWDESHDNFSPTIAYELRASLDANQLGDASDSASTAWYSSRLETNSFAFLSITSAMDGMWYWQVRAIDESGNKSTWSNTWHVLVDTNGPAIAVQNPKPAELFGGPGRQLIEFSASIDDDSGVKSYSVQLDGVDKTKVVLEGQPMPNVTTTGSFNANELEDGDHIIRLSATDYFGNENELLRGFTVDKIAPVITTSIEDNQVVVGTVQVNLLAAEAHPDVYTIEILKDGRPIAKGDSGVKVKNTNGNNLIYEWDTTKLSNGNYQLQLSGRDMAGNESTILRNIRINNVIAGSGGISTKENVDSLLDQLSKELSQPLLTTNAPDITSQVPVIVSKVATDGNANAARFLTPETDRNAKVIVAPSEHGWRIFGVLWFWWALLVLAFGSVWYRWRQANKSFVTNDSI